MFGRKKKEPQLPPTDEVRRLGERLALVCGVTVYGEEGIAPYQVNRAGKLLIEQADEIDRLRSERAALDDAVRRSGTADTLKNRGLL